MFSWDPRKAESNRRKHRVTFDEAESAFYDDQARYICDPEQSEDRFILIGMSAKLRILVVCHCFRLNDSTIRIISARKATPRERQHYESAR